MPLPSTTKSAASYRETKAGRDPDFPSATQPARRRDSPGTQAWRIPEPVGLPPGHDGFLKWSGKVPDSPEAACRGHDAVSRLTSGCRHWPAAQSWSPLRDRELTPSDLAATGPAPAQPTAPVHSPLVESWVTRGTVAALEEHTRSAGGRLATHRNTQDAQPRAGPPSPLVWGLGGADLSPHPEPPAVPGLSHDGAWRGFWWGANLAPTCSRLPASEGAAPACHLVTQKRPWRTLAPVLKASPLGSPV